MFATHGTDEFPHFCGDLPPIAPWLRELLTYKLRDSRLGLVAEIPSSPREVGGSTSPIVVQNSELMHTEAWHLSTDCVHVSFTKSDQHEDTLRPKDFVDDFPLHLWLFLPRKKTDGNGGYWAAESHTSASSAPPPPPFPSSPSSSPPASSSGKCSNLPTISFLVDIPEPIHAELERLQLLFLLRLKDSFASFKMAILKYLTIPAPETVAEEMLSPQNFSCRGEVSSCARGGRREVVKSVGGEGVRGEEEEGGREENEGGRGVERSGEGQRERGRPCVGKETAKPTKEGLGGDADTTDPLPTQGSHTPHHLTKGEGLNKPTSSPTIGGCVLVHSVQADLLLPSLFSLKPSRSTNTEADTPITSPLSPSPSPVPLFTPGTGGMGSRCSGVSGTESGHVSAGSMESGHISSLATDHSQGYLGEGVLPEQAAFQRPHPRQPPPPPPLSPLATTLGTPLAMSQLSTLQSDAIHTPIFNLSGSESSLRSHTSQTSQTSRTNQINYTGQTGCTGQMGHINPSGSQFTEKLLDSGRGYPYDGHGRSLSVGNIAPSFGKAAPSLAPPSFTLSPIHHNVTSYSTHAPLPVSVTSRESASNRVSTVTRERAMNTVSSTNRVILSNTLATTDRDSVTSSVSSTNIPAGVEFRSDSRCSSSEDYIFVQSPELPGKFEASADILVRVDEGEGEGEVELGMELGMEEWDVSPHEAGRRAESVAIETGGRHGRMQLSLSGGEVQAEGRGGGRRGRQEDGGGRIVGGSISETLEDVSGNVECEDTLTPLTATGTTKKMFPLHRMNTASSLHSVSSSKREKLPPLVRVEPQYVLRISMRNIAALSNIQVNEISLRANVGQVGLEEIKSAERTQHERRRGKEEEDSGPDIPVVKARIEIGSQVKRFELPAAMVSEKEQDMVVMVKVAGLETALLLKNATVLKDFFDDEYEADSPVPIQIHVEDTSLLLRESLEHIADTDSSLSVHISSADIHRGKKIEEINLFRMLKEEATETETLAVNTETSFRDRCLTLREGEDVFRAAVTSNPELLCTFRSFIDAFESHVSRHGGLSVQLHQPEHIAGLLQELQVSLSDEDTDRERGDGSEAPRVNSSNSQPENNPTLMLRLAELKKLRQDKELRRIESENRDLISQLTQTKVLLAERSQDLDEVTSECKKTKDELVTHKQVLENYQEHIERLLSENADLKGHISDSAH